ncbi:MAG: DNA-binding protein [Candidatus Omnitrophica bacterium]|nr:DNA-binding protein [Candidatus Omnitrophota bacterium]
MIRVIRSILGILFFVCLSGHAEAATTEITLDELLKNYQQYDGKIITFKGEAIGDIILRGKFCWVNVSDPAGGVIGVFGPRELAEEITCLGGYRFSGDIISVRGVFSHACGEHGGDTDIHAEKITVLEKGKALSHLVEPWKIRLSIYLPGIVLVLALIHLIIRRFR